MSLEELAVLPVTSVSGVEQELFRTPAAIRVLRSEDIQRGGHTHLAEALRMVPGVHVARLDSRTWGVSTRGFNSEYANKQLVLMDGRILYNQLFSGVIWDRVDFVLEDLDRIEVIRGPGPTLWGANAVNGVININTKHAAQTQGGYASFVLGSEDRAIGELRYGGAHKDTYYRIWAKYVERDGTERADGSDRPDDWGMLLTGLRIDHDVSPDRTFTLQGDFQTSDRLGNGLSVPGTAINTSADFKLDNGSLRARYTDDGLSHNGGLQLQAYLQRENAKRVLSQSESNTIAEVDLRYHREINSRNELVTGVTFRHRVTDAQPTEFVALNPSRIATKLYSGFLQNTYTVVPERWFLMAGSKFEDNSLTGFEWQPSARVWYTPDENHTYWAAVSRPVRAPSLVDRYFTQLGLAIGNPELDSEKLVSLEAGFRRKWESFDIDLALFFNEYDNLLSASSGGSSFGNDTNAASYGFEIEGRWLVDDHWKLTSSYSFLEVDQDRSDMLSLALYEERSPHHQAQLRSHYELSKNLDLDLGLYYLDTAPLRDGEAYLRTDLGLSWRPDSHWEFSLWGQNLTEESHTESLRSTDQLNPTYIERSVYLRGTYRF